MPSLSPQKKAKLKQKAKIQAQREKGGGGAIARAEIKAANSAYRDEVQSARGAQRVQVSQLSNMLAGIQDSGLRGKYAAQTAHELRARKMDAISGLPYMIADAQDARREAVAAARDDLLAQQLDLRQEAGKNYNALLDEARDAKADRMESGGMSDGVKSALIVANTYLKSATPKERQALLADPGGFILGVAKEAEGADQVDAKRAVQILIERINKPVGSAAWAKEKRKRTG